MMGLQYDTVCSVLVLLPILIHVKTNAQDISNAQHFSDTKFNSNEYLEYPDNEERDKEILAQLDQMQHSKNNYPKTSALASRLSKEDWAIPDIPLPSRRIHWQREWASQLNLTQASAVSIDPNCNIAIFHRGNRIWGSDTFDNANRFNPANGPITQNTIVLLDKDGNTILEWGRDMFYLPHGLTIDQYGNYWITDVAMHQVFKFDAQDIEKLMKYAQPKPKPSTSGHHSSALFENSLLKPSLVLGVAFEPGNDEIRFCKPTTVAVHTNGDFFVSDGYCNSRIIKFNKNGERILVWGRHWGIGGSAYSQLPPPNAFVVPHALALASSLNYIYVADRENGRVLCFFANNGTFHKEYSHPSIGTKIYSVAYARGRLYLVNGPDPYALRPVRVQGFVLDIYSGKILSTFRPTNITSGSMNNPHDLAVTEDGAEIYVVELNNHKVYKFLQGINDSTHPENLVSTNRRRPMILVHPDTKDADTEKSNMTKLILGLGSAAISFIIICVAIAAIVARCQKRGRAYHYDEATVEFSKLVE